MKERAITAKNIRIKSKSQIQGNETEISSGCGTDGCTSNDHMMASLLKAVAHPVRIRILRLLSKNEGSLCSCDIESHFPLKQPTISHHMKILKEASLVENWQEGSRVHYILSDNCPIPVKEIIGDE